MYRYRGFVSDFESLAFFQLAGSRLYREAVAGGATSLATKEATLDLLGKQGYAAAHPNNPMSAVVLSSPDAQMTAAWAAAVVACGLSMEDYGLLRAFKRASNDSFHQQPEISQALNELGSIVPLPEGCTQYKGALTALLNVLARV